MSLTRRTIVLLCVFVFVLERVDVTSSQPPVCIPVYDTVNFCFNPSTATSVPVTVTCPPGYIVKVSDASIYGASSCPPPAVSPPTSSNPAASDPMACSMLDGLSTLKSSLLSACAMQQMCTVTASLPSPPVTNCTAGATFAQVTYRCEARHDINGTARALAITSNMTFTGNLINVDSMPLALTGLYITECAGTCQLTVPPGTEAYVMATVFIKANPMLMFTCDQHIALLSQTTPNAPPTIICSNTQQPVLLPCTATPTVYDISYVTDDVTVPVIFVVQIYVHYTQMVSIYCGFPMMTTVVPTTMTMMSSTTTTSPPSSSSTTSPPIFSPTSSTTTVMVPVASTFNGLQWPIPMIIGLVLGFCLLLMIIVILCACMCRRRAHRKAKKAAQRTTVIIDRADILREGNDADKPPFAPATVYTADGGVYGRGAGYGSPASLLSLPANQPSVVQLNSGAMTSSASLPNLLNVHDYRPYAVQQQDLGYNSATTMLAASNSIPYSLNNVAYSLQPSGDQLPGAVRHFRPTTVVINGAPSSAPRPGDISYPLPGRPGSTVVYQ